MLIQPYTKTEKTWKKTLLSAIKKTESISVKQKKYKLGAYFMVIFFSISVHAYESVYDARGNFSDELMDCAAFNLIVSAGYLKSGNQIEANDWKQSSERYLALSKALSDTTFPEAFDSRFRLIIKKQEKEINDNFSNISILIEKHGELCKAIYADPDKRLEYWLNKEKRI